MTFIIILLISVLLSAIIPACIALLMFSDSDDINIIVISIVFSIIFVPIMIIYSIWGYGFHYNIGRGDHFGYITSTETNGIIFKTDRIYFKTSIRSSQEDRYCVINNKVFNGLKKLNSNDQVKIKYVSYYSNGIANCDGESAVITGFTKIEEK